MTRQDFKIFLEDEYDEIFWDIQEERFTVVKNKKDARVVVRKNNDLYDAFWSWSTPKYEPADARSTIKRIINLFYIYSKEELCSFVGVKNIKKDEDQPVIDKLIEELKSNGIEAREIYNCVPWNCNIIVEVYDDQTTVYPSEAEEFDSFEDISLTVDKVKKLRKTTFKKAVLKVFEDAGKDFI